MDKPLLTACIVTYNSKEHIGKVLKSLLDSSIADRMNVMVVDNASTDDTVKVVEADYPNIHLIKLVKNIGFGQGHNQALPYLTAPYHLIVNPDITFEVDILEKMAAFMDSRKDVVMLTPKVVHPDGSEQFLPKELPCIHYLLGGYLERLGRPFTTWRGQYTWHDRNIKEPCELSFATGCFMFARTEAFVKAGGFDPRYFLYMEDADLTRNMKQRGLTLYHPGMTVSHVWARDNVHSAKGTRIHISSMIRYFNKWGWKF